MAGETPAEFSEDEEEIRKRKKRLGEGILGAPRKEAPVEKAPAAIDFALGKVAAETDKAVKKPKAERAEHEAEFALTPDEQAEAERQIIAARKGEVADELAAADPSEVPAIEADEQYLDNVDRRIQAGELPEDAVEAEFAARAGLSDEVVEGEFGEDGSEGEVALHAGGHEPLPASLSTHQEAILSEPPRVSPEQPTTFSTGGAVTAETLAPAAVQAAGEAVAVAGGLVVLMAEQFLKRRSQQKRMPERQAQALKKSFERQVRQLHNQLTVHEEQIRRLARERNEAVEAAREARPAPSAVRAEQKPQQPEVIHANMPVPDAERLALSDILDISERVRVGTESVRQIYEGNRISQRGLRRIVAEYLHGGNVRKVLKQELLIKAIAPELDPLLRDQVPVTMTPVSSSAQITEDNLQSTADAGQYAASNQSRSRTSSPIAGVSTSALVVANIVALLVLGVLVALLFVILMAR